MSQLLMHLYCRQVAAKIALKLREAGYMNWKFGPLHCRISTELFHYADHPES